MTVKELIKKLSILKYQDCNITASIDTSTNDEDFENRCFSDDCIGVQEEINRNQIILLFDCGFKNN